VFGQNTSVDPMSVVQLVQQQSRQFKLVGSNQLQFKHEHNQADKRIEFINSLLDQLSKRKKSAA
jgi:transcription-repair coupling factor (superfamily II helicase)